MNTFQRVSEWSDRHQSKWLGMLRMLLGVTLFFKGLSFIVDKDMTMGILAANDFEFIPLLIVHYVIIFQMAHSVLIIAGLITRIAALAQLPIVAGAVLLIATTGTFAPLGSDLYLAAFLLFLLCFFLVYGAGPLSVDAALKRRRASGDDLAEESLV
jgi:uncharacterized membrane protein YphA (DoxX/SURF4 family)